MQNTDTNTDTIRTAKPTCTRCHRKLNPLTTVWMAGRAFGAVCATRVTNPTHRDPCDLVPYLRDNSIVWAAFDRRGTYARSFLTFLAARGYQREQQAH